MTRNLGISDTPAARRVATPGWRDPRLWVGVAIVAVSVLAGAWAFGTSDDTVPVWAATTALPAGHRLTADDLSVRRVRFAADGDRLRYLAADRQLPADAVLLRPVGEGELLPGAAVGRGGAAGAREVPISVAPDQVPRGVEVGDVVDVYLRPATHTGCAGSPVCSGSPVLSGVTVADAPAVEQQFGPDGARMLVLSMDESSAHRFFRVLASTDDPALTVVGRG
ncbi:MAG: SAF domain-containing protein [Nocardioides sp.]